MTREEAIADIKYNIKPIVGGKSLDMAIEALEQNDILDKIIEEIEQMDFDFGDFYDHTDTIIQMVLEVIDKYKAENEETDADSN